MEIIDMEETQRKSSKKTRQSLRISSIFPVISMKRLVLGSLNCLNKWVENHSPSAQVVEKCSFAKIGSFKWGKSKFSKQWRVLCLTSYFYSWTSIKKKRKVHAFYRKMIIVVRLCRWLKVCAQLERSSISPSTTDLTRIIPSGNCLWSNTSCNTTDFSPL